MHGRYSQSDREVKHYSITFLADFISDLFHLHNGAELFFHCAVASSILPLFLANVHFMVPNSSINSLTLSGVVQLHTDCYHHLKSIQTNPFEQIHSLFLYSLGH